jgi:hypothetical protein
MPDILFEERALADYLKWHEKKMIDAINLLPPEDIRGVDLESLVTQFTDKYRLTTPVLDESEKTVEQNYLVPGEQKVHIAVVVPYVGYSYLFRCRPQVPHPVDPGGIGLYCRDDALEFRIVLSTPDTAELKRQLTPLLETIKAGLAKIDSEIRPFNEALQSVARDRLRATQGYVSNFDSFTGALPSLGFHLKRRGDEAEQVIIPLTRKPFPVSDLAAPGQLAEPGLTLKNLDEIMRSIDSMIHVMERSPSVFADMGEEELRTILLVVLNGLFEGAATGETFNRAGKTDILIRVLDRNIFIAECLIWGGPEHFRKKLDDQLFTYSTWRDSQLVAIVFNRNKGFTEVIERIQQVVREHSQCVQELEYAHASGCRCLFRRADDPERHFFLTAIAYDVPR